MAAPKPLAGTSQSNAHAFALGGFGGASDELDGGILPTLVVSATIFTTPLRFGLTVAVLECAAVCLGAGFWDKALLSSGNIWGSTLSAFFVMLIRVLTERQYLDNERDRREAALLQREAISRDVHDLLGHSLTVLTLKPRWPGAWWRLNLKPPPKN